MKKTLLLAATFLAISSAAAFAEGPYVAGDLGLSINHDSDITAPGFVGTAEYKMGFGFDLAVGYSFKENIRAEAEFGYRAADVDKFSDGPADSEKLTVLTYMANGYYDFSQFKLPVTPYAGLGLGLINGEFKTPGEKFDDTTMGYQLMLGASYPIDKNLSVNAGYKFQSTFSDLEKNSVKFSYSNSTLLVGARYNF